jgi:cell division protein ZapB
LKFQRFITLTSSTSTTILIAGSLCNDGQMPNPQLKALTLKIDDLIQLCAQLDKENRTLKSEASLWQHEREQLIEKTEMARSRVESMINRLKALEKES